ncbi:phage repressor protein [Providencia rettgeri]|uniref:Phage repressor protein n=1 Tax=Providencia rettgeri TaxID=587 RepID=A0AAP2NXW8_PRORE|nr:helix-turn-helix domain-containing protein [Providencia rettgeri]MBX6949708.1 phage repressor protein [Providencia rettgeri]MBX6957916.1 phage repressor protein [Providencia rettgeri]MBX6974618.1 phage repressor protein [Providencia rettgeri]MBX6982865.1 phage repressor protein [Providencia rettgeri]MBX6987592.1 phage repressor protein [Providencia rettgeri]
MSKKEIEIIIDRLKSVFNVTTDSALCRALDVSPQTLSSWKLRDSIPYAICVDISIKQNVSLDWLLLGRGERVNEACNEIVTSAVSNSDLTLIELLGQLDPEVKKDILRRAEEKQQMINMQKELDKLALELERVKKIG